MTTAATGSVSRDARDGEQSSGSSPQPVRAHGPPEEKPPARRPAVSCVSKGGGFVMTGGSPIEPTATAERTSLPGTLRSRGVRVRDRCPTACSRRRGQPS